MIFKPLDMLAIGDTTIDAFIKIKDATVHCDANNANCTISLKFADKVEYEFMEEVPAVGNSANAAVALARLGATSALATHLGDDDRADLCIRTLKKNGVKTDYIEQHSGMQTNYHYVLWYEAERTILVHHQEYPYSLPKTKTPKWIYLSSLAANSYDYQLSILAYVQAHPEVKFCFQPGTFQMKLGLEKMAGFYKRADVFVCNVEEAQRILAKNTPDLKSLLADMFALGPKLVLITDGPQGAYMYDGTTAYFMPIYPDPKPPYERTGCGDAFASTFVAALNLGKTPLEALHWAPINPMSVVQYVGAQKGLLTRDALETLLKNAPTSYTHKVL